IARSPIAAQEAIDEFAKSAGRLQRLAFKFLCHSLASRSTPRRRLEPGSETHSTRKASSLIDLHCILNRQVERTAPDGVRRRPPRRRNCSASPLESPPPGDAKHRRRTPSIWKESGLSGRR